MTGQSIARKGDEGAAYWVLGGLYEVLVSGEETGGGLTLMRMTVPAGASAPPHTHPGGEAMYVLDGEVTVHIGDEQVTATRGASFYFPAGTREFFVANTDATVLAAYLPGGIGKFFSEVGEVALSRTIPPASDTPPDFDTIISTAATYGMNIEVPEA